MQEAIRHECAAADMVYVDHRSTIPGQAIVLSRDDECWEIDLWDLEEESLELVEVMEDEATARSSFEKEAKRAVWLAERRAS